MEFINAVRMKYIICVPKAKFTDNSERERTQNCPGDARSIELLKYYIYVKIILTIEGMMGKLSEYCTKPPRSV